MLPQHKIERENKMADPAWLKALKKESKDLGVPIRELLVKAMPKPATTKKAAESKTMKAAKGGMVKGKK
jgi:hypothetical protein